MSLRWRIMGSIVLVIVLTVLTSVGVGYYATQHRLGVFVDEIGDDEAVQLARNLSREYTASGGWEAVDRALSEAGYIYDGVLQRERSEESKRGVLRALPQRSDTSRHRERRWACGERQPIRAVTRNHGARLGRASRDGIRLNYRPTRGPRLCGCKPGVPIDRVAWFLNTLLYITLIGGTLTAGVAILLAAWLSKRITAPVTALTEATQAIAQGDTARLPVTSSDELGKMSAAFNRMTSTLETQRDLRRRLINDVSHELNTPLSVIQLEARGLRDGLQTPESASDHIIQEVERLRGLVTDLDWLAETDHGELRLTLEEVSVYELLAAEFDRWHPQSQARRVELSLEVSADLPDMDLDRMRMSQALGNVLSNAIHSTEAGGSIVLRAGLESDGVLAISIIDDGIGIDAADLPHVFDRFYRTDQSRSRGIGGTGLGLAITRAIVEAHGGTIAIASGGLGQGVTVTIRLPLDK